MKRLLLLGAVWLSASSLAHARESEEQAAGKPEQEPAQAAPAQAAPAQAPAAEPAPRQPPTARCVLGAHDGVEASDARTAALLVCDALREQGAMVQPRVTQDDGTATGKAYRIELRALGSSAILRVSYESPLGTARISRTTQLSDVEEASTAAPRVAESIVNGTPLEQTARVDNLYGEEAKSYRKRYGETLFGVGIFGFGIPDTDVLGGYGVFARLYYETPAYAVGLDLRAGGSGDNAGDSSLVSLGVGARYFLTEGEISPFFGGGIGVMWLSLRDNRDDDLDELCGSGVTANGEVGVEFLRFYRSRLDVFLRVDAPIFDLESPEDELYALPISLVASYSFE